VIGPATNTRVEVGINNKNLESNGHLIAMPAGSLCNFKVKISNAQEVDDDLIAWIKVACDNAG